MPDLILNCAGTTRTVGTANPVVTGTTGKARSILTDLTDGQEVAYYRSYASSKAGFENATGTWDVATSSIIVNTIEASSNSGAPVVWGVGLQNIVISLTPAMLAGIDPGDMDAAAQFNGTELFAISQGGYGVAGTARQVLGKPVTRFMGHSRNRYQDFSHLHRTSTTFDSGNTAGTLFGAEPFLCWASGTDAKVTQGSVTYSRVGIAACNLGTQITGYSACVSSFYPLAFNQAGTEPARVDIMASLSSVPSGAQNYIVQVGFFSAPTALATHGVFFRGTLTDTDWRTMVKNSVGQDTSATGALLTASEYSIFSVAPTFGVEHDPEANKFNFYINGALVAEEDDTYTPTIFEPMYMGVAIFRTNGTVNRLVLMDALQYSIPDSFASGTYF